MVEIKSVRLKYEFKSEIINNYKLTLNEGRNKSDRDIFVFRVDDNGEFLDSNLSLNYNYNSRYKNWSSDDYINDWISIQSSSGKKISILQDPWQNNPPYNRNFGFDPYYLNNGSRILIKWFDNGLQIGGYEWSDEKGNELEIKRGLTMSNKSLISKSIMIIPPIESTDPSFTIYESTFRTEGLVEYFIGTITDNDIINQAISIWKNIIPNYSISLCDQSNKFCSIIDYSSPVILDNKPSDGSDSPVQTSGTQSSVNLSVVLDENLEVIARSDVNKIKIFIGDPFDPFDKFISDEDFDDSFLIQDTLEKAFSGPEEESIVLQNETLDNPVGPSDEDGYVSTGTSIPGPGPIKGSKLTNKAGTHMLNLAGHRLSLVLKDLENYLNANGFAGAKIGNNGIMRSLKDSAYPNSPLRAAASLHGAGLAIDVKFNIPGKKWNSISDNSNLASDGKLTKVIMNWVKSQGDITWGAQWGKGSNPGSGVVNGRGVDEYHHFEIRSNIIPKYWDPVSDELNKIGFKPSQLTSPGKGSNLHKLMIKLIG